MPREHVTIIIMETLSSICIKALLINPTDAHNYKITGILKAIKIPTIAPTCFGSRRNHHQGAISCLAKTTIMVLLCSSLMTWSMSWRHISLLCKRAVPHTYTTERWHRELTDKAHCWSPGTEARWSPLLTVAS